MKPFGLFTLFLLVYSIIWIAVIIGMALLKKGNSFAIRMRKWVINTRIQQFQYPPFKNLLELWVAGRFFPASAMFILIAIPAAFLFFLLGMTLISPILAIWQGLIVGFLTGTFDRRHMVWLVLVGSFEFGYWALSGALGMFVTAGFLFDDMSFVESFLNSVDILLSGYWIPIAICILVNAFGEVAGPIYWNLQGPIPLETLSKGQYINDERLRTNPTAGEM